MAVLQADASRECAVLIVDDEERVRNVLTRQLVRAGNRCAAVATAKEGLAHLERNDCDVILVDLYMPEMDGIRFLKALGTLGVDAVPVVLTGRPDTAKAVEAMKAGAFDFIEKFCAFDTLGGVVARARDHRRLKRRAREMAELAAHWEATFDAVPDLIAIIDESHRILRVNRAMAERLNLPPSEIEGALCHTLIHGQDNPILQCPHSDALLDGTEHMAQIHEPRLGGDFLVTASPLYNAAGHIIGSVHVARDITAQKYAEDQLRKAHAETENLLASMSSFLIRVDEAGIVTRWNTQATTLFGIEPADALGRPFLELPLPWDTAYVARQFPQWQTATRPVRLPEMRCAVPDRPPTFLDVTANPVRSANGTPAGFFLLGTDVTERKNLESQLVHAQKLESIGQLAAGIAHEINTPTQYVGDNTRFLQGAFHDLCELLDRYGELSRHARERGFEPDLVEEIERTVERIDLTYLLEEIPRAIHESLHGVERVARIVRAMKEFSHPGTAEKTPVDLNRAIEGTVTVARNEWKYVAEMETQFDPDLPMVSCLPGEFNQVILNIIIHAAHAIGNLVGDGAGGKGKITVSTRRDGEWVEIRIADTGCGIPERVGRKVFYPFFTTK